jgi:hypothetical protein
VTYGETSSGLLIPSKAAEQHEEHPARRVIREAMANLKEQLDGFEQTTHGVLTCGDFDSVCGSLARCYDETNAYTISDLAQVIRCFVEKSK